MSIYLYGRLDADWARVGASEAARESLSRWQETEPILAGWVTPASLVATIVASREWGNPDPRLAALVRLADERLAARAVLQAILPGLAAEPLFYPRHHSRLGGRDERAEDVAADLVGAAWEAIRARAGTTLADPENTLVRAAAGRLRTKRRIELRTRSRTAILEASGEGGRADIGDARSGAEQAVLILVDAVRDRRLTARQAELFYGVRVARVSGTTAARAYGLTRGQVFYAVTVAETVVRRAIA